MFLPVRIQSIFYAVHFTTKRAIYFYRSAMAAVSAPKINDTKNKIST